MKQKSEKLVTVLTPCYNVEKYIHRLLDSILIQTYSNIEMIIVDDGSTDKSKIIIESYREKFEIKGYKLKYVYQTNQGLSSVINNGLKLVNGDYLVWPDSDDWYESKNVIKELAEVLDNSDETVSMARCQYLEVDETTLEVVKKFGLRPDTKEKEYFFEDCLFLRNDYWLLPGGYMAKVNKIDELIPNREIYTERFAGQNFQLHLPLLYKHKLLTVENYSFNYLRRQNSFTRGMYKQMDMYSAFKNTVLNTIKNINFDSIDEKKKYILKTNLKYDIIFFSVYLDAERYSDAKKILLESNHIPKKLWVKYFMAKLPFLKTLLKK